ncbi:MAG: polysaccharide deacetylase family protein, partial [Verrucomicrobiota bacterium]
MNLRWLAFLLILAITPALLQAQNAYYYGGIARGDSNKKEVALIFTGGWHSEGTDYILKVLKEKNAPGSFFLTGNYLRKAANAEGVRRMISDGHYVGAHSDNHPKLVKSFTSSTLISKTDYFRDLDKNFAELAKFGLKKSDAVYYIPPYETYNTTIAQWTTDYGLILFKQTDGTRTNGDYTDPSMSTYYSSDRIMSYVWECEAKDSKGLNGHMMLIHLGVGAKRTDKFYYKLGDLIDQLRQKGYQLNKVDDHLNAHSATQASTPAPAAPVDSKPADPEPEKV